jgi:NhaP-type Na+/H+ or K+/H+ antiporter
VGTGINWLERRRLMKRDAFVAYPVALAITVVSFAEVLHLSSVFAVFCAGLFLVLTTRNRSLETEVRARHTMSQFFEIPLFFLIGLILPWDAWAALGWKAWVFAVGVLFLRRLPLVLVAGRWIAPLRELPERIFVGWFGPIGLSSLYYAAFAVRLTHQPSLWTWVSLAIFASVMVNGVTSTWLTRRYASLRPLAPRDRDEEAAQDDSGPDDGGVPGAHTQH